MERKVTSFFSKWKNDIIKKPLVVYGPKQIGKTFTILEFGKKEYKNTIYFNTAHNDELVEIFKKEKSIDRIILALSLLSGETILKEETLIVFDRVDDIEIVKGIKLFGNGKTEYHIIMVTSKRDNLVEFKGEELQFKGMHGMDFEEFLWANNEHQLATLIRKSFTNNRSLPFHQVALDLFIEYLLTGGKPEVVFAKSKGASFDQLIAIKDKIIDTYIKEIVSNPVLIDIPRGVEVLNVAPKQLAKENKKFQYGMLGQGRRAKEYESTINYIVNNQMLYRSYLVRNIRPVLSSAREKDNFKLYLNDDGLLSSMMHLTEKKIISDENIKETIYENHIAKTLAEAGYALNYYQSAGKAEVHFVIQNRMGKIIPIELTVRSMSKAKSLSVFMKKHTTEEAYRITENNFSTKKGVRYLPIYAVFCLNDSKM